MMNTPECLRTLPLCHEVECTYCCCALTETVRGQAATCVLEGVATCTGWFVHGMGYNVPRLPVPVSSTRISRCSISSSSTSSTGSWHLCDGPVAAAAAASSKHKPTAVDGHASGACMQRASHTCM